MRRYQNLFIDGRWRPSTGHDDLTVDDAATEELIAAVPAGTAADAGSAVAAARRAFDGWAATPLAERVGFLSALADRITANLDGIAALVSHEVGTPITSSAEIQARLPLADVRNAIAATAQVEWQSEIGNSRIVREPAGVVAAITPWNFPLHQICAKVAPALAVGCTVVLKPSELAPGTAFQLAEFAAEAGLPAGVFNVVTGTGPVVGEALASDPDVDMVSFTGSGAAGARVMTLAAPSAKRVALELGGKSASVVLDDADLDTAVTRTVASCFNNNGQTCSAWTRLLVPGRLLGEAEEIAAAAVHKQVVGDPFDRATTVGPLISAVQRDRVRAHVERAIAQGARVVTGGAGRPAGLATGYFVTPTVLSDVGETMDVARHEVFGPVLAILAFDDDEDAVRIANGTPYGLSGAVWSGDPGRADSVGRRMRTGQVAVNGGPFNPAAPFGGYKSSGIGRELGRFGLEEFLETKALHHVN